MVTVEVDEGVLQQLQAYLGDEESSALVQKALDLCLREQQVRELLRKVRNGETDYSLTNDELEAMWNDGPDRQLSLD